MKIVQMGPMSTFKQRATHIALGLGLAATLAFGAVMPAMAAPGEGTGTANVTAGVNTATVAPFAFDDAAGVATTGVRLTGADQTATAAPVITVVDATGTESGWSVTMKLSNIFSDGGGTPTTFVAAPSVTGTVIKNSSNQTVTPTGLTTGDINGDTGVAIAGVAAFTPGGTYTVTPTIAIEIPENTKVAIYTGILTVDTAPAIAE